MYWHIHAYATTTPTTRVQVLEDLEALVKLLSSRASDAESSASNLQKHVTALRATADQASKDQAALSKQQETSKKEAAAAKRVLTIFCRHSKGNTFLAKPEWQAMPFGTVHTHKVCRSPPGQRITWMDKCFAGSACFPVSVTHNKLSSGLLASDSHSLPECRS